jgi:tRNA nucleotidyltransferase (CCA-adding enzyme)
MADYIYLLENRLSAAQKGALSAVRDVARNHGLTLFLTGGAVRDLTSGSPVRDLDVAVQGNALKLKKDIELAGGVVTGQIDGRQALFLRFPGGVRLEVASTMAATYPKPGKAVYTPGTILEDLRRRDFTANAMALSLNDGSYGLLMDPLNGVADIENRELRLVSNYGFIEEPVRLIRAARFAARLGWNLEEKTLVRYETGKTEGYVTGLTDLERGYESEEIVHEEDPLRVIRRLEAEGWMPVLAPAWGSSKANVAELEKVRDTQTQLQLQGIHPDPSTVNFPLLTAKMGPKEIAALKKSFPRQGFVAEIEALEGEAKEFAAQLGSKAAAKPSAAYQMILAAKPEAVLYVAYATKSGALQAKFKSFFTEWQKAKQAIPYALMQEMRITPEIDGYDLLLEKLFFELMDGNLGTAEEMKAFLEPYSPPAPPPPVHTRRPRVSRKDAKSAKAKAKKEAEAASDGDDDEDDDEFEAPSPGDEDEVEEIDEVVDLVSEALGGGLADESEAEDEADEAEDEVAAKPVAAPKRAEKAAAISKAVVPLKSVPPPAVKAMPAGAPKVAAPVKKAAKAPVVAAKAVPAKVPAKAAPVKVVPVKAAAVKAAPKSSAKAVKVAAKPVPKGAKKVVSVAKAAPAKAAKKVAAVAAKGKPVAAKKTVAAKGGQKVAVKAGGGTSAKPAASKGVKAAPLKKTAAPAKKVAVAKKAVPAKKAVAKKVVAKKVAAKRGR